MDGILALGHFCEVHGPCVILSTQRRTTPDTNITPNHALTIPWCSACASLALDQAFTSTASSPHTQYITTRTPLQQELAFLLRQATVRSLSCEYESDGGTVYFGDDERGHVVSHTFRVQDSLARGFCRKYTLLMLMRDKVHLLNAWPVLVPQLKEIARDLQDKANCVNTSEQTEKPQRSLRQGNSGNTAASSSTSSLTRSLAQLTGQPAVYAHLHLWFSWLLGCPVAVEARPAAGPPRAGAAGALVAPTLRQYSVLRILRQDMGVELFNQICYYTLIGVPTTFVESPRTRDSFRSLLPQPTWPPAPHHPPCLVYQTEAGWAVRCSGSLTPPAPPNPSLTPTLQRAVDRALGDDQRLPEAALEPLLRALLMRWLHTAHTLTLTLRCGGRLTGALLRALEVRPADVIMLRYWCANVGEGGGGRRGDEVARAMEEAFKGS